MTYNFDTCADRRHSDATKYRKLSLLYGRDDITPMWIADMDFEVHPKITEALSTRIAHPVYGYAVVPDDFFPSILDWLDRRHGFHATTDEITFVAGIVRALGYLVNRLTVEGDKVLIQPPVYHPFHNIVVNNGRTAIVNPLRRRDDGFYDMDLEHFEQVVSEERPRVFILCNPHNPIGIQWDADTLATIARVCRKYGVTVISDEIHADLMLPGVKHIPYLSVGDDAVATGIMLGAPSKTFNIAGIESSWMIIKNPDLRNRVFPWMEANEFSSPTFMATAATVAAYRHGDQWLDEALAYISDNIDLVAERLPRLTDGLIKVIKPQASFLVWLDCRGLNLDHDSLNRFFVDEARIAFNDGAMFGDEGNGFMRMNIAAPRSVIETAVNAIAAAVKNISR